MRGVRTVIHDGAMRLNAPWYFALFCAVLLLTIFGSAGLLQAQSTPVTAGYRDFYFGKSVNGLLTGEKPQSKLWWNDGLWWGSLWDLTLKKYTIHRFNVATQSWTSTGTVVDNRVNSKGDALWDGQHLYFVSQHYTSNPGPAENGDEGKLYRYSYNAASKSYSLDAGFPVIVNNSVSETLVLAKDSAGKLWVTWTEGGKVKVNRSLGDDLTWGTPFDLPVQGTDTKIDDISSILAFGGNKIGILWSNQNDKKSYFAVHLDGNADEVWEPKEQALADAALGAVSYDHINLKPSCDNDGNVYAATKTNLTNTGLPLVYLLKRTAAGVWTRYVVSTVDEGYIRPIVLIDGAHQKIYVFATSDASNHRIIYMKSSDLSNIAFPAGLGTPFIQSATDTVIMNPTSTKQCLNGATGLLVLAADQHTRFYLHNYLDLSGGISQFTLTANTAPQGGGSVTLDPPGGVYNAGTMVTLTATPNSGYQFSGWSGDLSGSSNPAAITMDANKSVTATFTAMQHILTVNTTGSGSVTLDPPGGVYSAGTMVTLTATPNSGYQFSDWSGDLSGSTNPAAITMDGNKNVTATFVANSIIHEESRTGGSSGSTTVTTLSSLAGVNGHLYLAAISTRPKKLVLSVTGLGLNWTLVKSICSGNNNSTLMEVWMAQGIPQGGSDGAVTATFASAPNSAVIAVSRYSGVAAANPIGDVIGGNTNGLNGACSGGVDGNAYSFNLATTANDAVVYGAVALKARTHTPGAGYTERVEFQHPHAVNPIGVAIEDKSVASPSSVTVNGSFNGLVDWAVVALEIRPATPPSGSFIVHEESRTGGSSGSTTVTTLSSLAGVNGHLYLAAISTRPKRLVLSVTGLGLNWTLVKSICSGNNNSTLMEVWMAQGIPQGGSDGAVTATFTSAPNSAVIAVSRYSGVAAANPIGNVIGGNTNGLNGACSGGVDGNAYSFNLTTTANDAVVYGAVALKARTHTPGAGYTERVEFQHPHAVNPIGVAIEDNSVASAATVAIEGSFNGLVDWAMVALEIKPQTAGPAQYTLTMNTVGSGSVTLDPAGGIYGAGTVVTLTATPAAGFQFSGWSGDLSPAGVTNPATIMMNGNQNVTATFAAIVHEETQTGGSSSSMTVATSTNLTGVSGHLYLAAISMQPKRSVLTVTGLGLNWTLVMAQCSGLNSIGVEVWMAQGIPQGGSNDAVTATLASAPSATVIAVSRYSGVEAVNPIGNVISGNTNGANASAACSGGVASSSYSFDLATTVNDAMVYSAVAMKARTHAPGAGYTERAEIKEVGGGLTSSIAVEDLTVAAAGNVTVNGSLSGTADWAEVGLELKPQATISKRGVVAGEEELTAPPSAYRLEQNYPNPFSSEARSRLAGNPGTMIDFALPAAGQVILNIYNETGQLVRTLVDGEMAAGRHAMRWNGRNQLGKTVAAGIYLYRIVVHGEDGNVAFARTQRMTFLK